MHIAFHNKKILNFKTYLTQEFMNCGLIGYAFFTLEKESLGQGVEDTV